MSLRLFLRSLRCVCSRTINSESLSAAPSTVRFLYHCPYHRIVRGVSAGGVLQYSRLDILLAEIEETPCRNPASQKATGCSTTKPTSWSRVLPEKLTVPWLVKKLPAFYGTRRFITAFTTACHLSLSGVTLMQ